LDDYWSWEEDAIRRHLVALAQPHEIRAEMTPIHARL